MTSLQLSESLSRVLGGRTAGAFERAFGMTTVGELLAHYPRRYAARGELTAIATMPLGETVTIVAEVLEVRERPMRARRGSLLEVQISDGKAQLALTFFNQSWRAAQLKPGVRGMFAGKVSAYRGALQLAHPDYELFEDEPDVHGQAERWALQPIPIYPATSTVSSWQIQKAIGIILDSLGEVEDPVPAELRRSENLEPLGDALEAIHRPETEQRADHAAETLRFHEAFLLQIALAEQRQQWRSHATQPRHAQPGGFLERFDATLPFSLTDDQRRVGEEIATDMLGPAPMNRLVQGEVGSGKTLVALRAVLAAIESGGQAAFLAPTEVLATQHLSSITAMLGPELSADVRPELLTGSLPAAARKRANLRIAAGQARIIVGTHALLSESVSFADLALVVIDEQHRFGVDQREALRAKGKTPPHVLVMTATPIPRTVAMTVFGDVDTSTIRQLPAGRAEIESFTVPLADRPGWFGRVWQRVDEEIALGRQAFVVCPAIDREDSASDAADGPDTPDAPAEPPADGPERVLSTVVDTVRELEALPLLAGRRVAALHGRMSSEEKAAVMAEVVSGAVDILVATTVIEVGVDVPNASVMVVLDADRFGVSQLHQLRGRVGRGGLPGLCLLVTGAVAGSSARERVDAVAATRDGFALAEVDLELRREGDVLGRAQSGGRSGLKLLRVASDGAVIEAARRAAHAIVESDPGLGAHPALRGAVDRRVGETERAALAKN